MESLLLADSDDETTPASNVQPMQAPGPPTMRQTSAGQPPQQQQPMSMSKADLSARLKSLYNPAMQAQQQPPQQQPMAMAPPTQPQRRVASQPVVGSPSGVRGPLVPNRPGAPQAAPLHPQQGRMTMAPPGHHRTTSQPMQTTQQQRHSDPLEPTPLTTLMQRTSSQPQQQQQQVMQQQQPTQQRYTSAGSSHRMQSTHPQQQQVQYQQQQQQQQRHVVQQQRQPYQHQQQQQQPNMMQPPSAGATSRTSSMPPPARQQSNSLPNPLQAGQGGHASSSHRSSSSGGVHRSSSGSSGRHHHSSSSSRGADQQKRQKEQFLMFTRVLMKYLEQKDPDMHARAKAVIRECAEKNKKKEKGYESVTLSMQTRLRQTVGTAYWERAGTYLQHFLKQKEAEVQRRKQAAAAAGGSSSGAGGASSSSAAAAAENMRLAQQQQKEKIAAAQAAAAAAEKKRQQQLALAKRKQEQMLKDQKHKLDKQREAQSKLAQIQKDNAAQIAKLQKQAPTPSPASTPTVSKKSTTKRPSTSSTTTTASKRTAPSATTTAPPMATPPAATMEAAIPEPKEYHEWMESLDHMVGYDVTTAALLVPKKSDLSLSEEQKRLLYGSSSKPATAEAPPPAPGRGWHRRNIVNARCAWAIARKPEVYRALKARKSSTPVVGTHSLPTKPPTTAEQQQQAKQPIPNEWLNEEKAEQDMVLQILSEATQMYLKQVVKQALVCARQRENLDGIRLWHLQNAKTKQPLSLRLGCDVERQVAQAEGNAALTVKRMEEAILREDAVVSAEIDPVEATSMSDLACKAPLSTQVVETADRDAKRSFEVYGGKHALQEPPFGRVPKRAKLSKRDLTLGLDLMSHHFTHSRPARGVIKLIM